MEKLENLYTQLNIFPPILYFGSAGLLGYDFYSIVFNKKELLNVYAETPLIIIFCLMTWWGVNRLQKK